MLETLDPLEPHSLSLESRKLRLGFAGIGWIGRHRMNALAATEAVEVAAITDPVKEATKEVQAEHPNVRIVPSYPLLLEEDLDGVVIATPSALHCAQAMAALERGLPVFCQKPLGRNAAETEAVIAAARRANRLLGVDLSYRFTAGMQRIYELVRSGKLGEITAIEAVFHNAYGPDKPWFYSRELAGGGCLLDLGIHLVDLALWVLDWPELLTASASIREGDRGEVGDRVEKHATGLVSLEGNVALQLGCSWGSHAGCDAEIRLQFFGTQGGAVFRNVNGSFYDFVAERFHSDRSREVLAEPPNDWGGRAAERWVRQLQDSPDFNPEIGHLTQVAAVLDRLYLENNVVQS